MRVCSAVATLKLLSICGPLAVSESLVALRLRLAQESFKATLPSKCFRHTSMHLLLGQELDREKREQLLARTAGRKAILSSHWENCTFVGLIFLDLLWKV